MELAVLGLTLAFVLFMGGYFTGRSQSAVSIAAMPENQMPGPAQSQVQSSLPKQDELNGCTNYGDDSAISSGSTDEQGPSIQNNQVQSDGRININTASKAQLTDLPGIGNVLAERIVDYRARNGAFNTIEDIRNVTGIGERRFEAIQDLITVGN